jgi:hypothetical protein
VVRRGRTARIQHARDHRDVLVLNVTNERIDEQLGVTGITAAIGAENVYGRRFAKLAKVIRSDVGGRGDHPLVGQAIEGHRRRSSTPTGTA